ncbi:hypothetical protein HDV05_008373 [Chytridiales sp. JEL 0842]|nr:hypothetical protein HDV05_008373 [Chytridiales sp. JEL 0842]
MPGDIVVGSIRGSHSGVATGAFLIDKSKSNDLVKALRSLGWLKSGTNVTRYTDPDIERGEADRVVSREGEAATREPASANNQSAKPAQTSSIAWDGTLAVHVNSEGAILIDRGILDEPALPSPTPAGDTNTKDSQSNNDNLLRIDPEKQKDLEAVKKLVRQGTAIWRKGLRVYSKGCLIASNNNRKKTQPTTTTEEPPYKKHKPYRFSYIELFAGIGGFRLALDPLGGSSVFASEISQSTKETYAANFGSDCLEGDITEIETLPEHDILTAGFPCQSFCKAGDRKGLYDARGELFFEVVRVLHNNRPKAFILENVANLVTMDDGAVFTIIKYHLEEAGYHIHYKIIDASLYVPQTRLRVYIVGFLSAHSSSRFQFPQPPTSPPPLLRSILDPNPDPSYTLTPAQLSSLKQSYTYKKNPEWRVARVDGRARTLMGRYKLGYRMYSEFVPVPLPEVGKGLKNDDDEEPEGVLDKVDDDNAQQEEEEEEEEKEAKDKGTVEEGKDLPYQLRFYTQQECARLMGFPDTFIMKSGKSPAATFYHQIGNAVVPLVVKAIAEEVLKALEI